MKICAKKLQKTIFSKVSLLTPLRNCNQVWKPIMTFKMGLMMTIWYSERFLWWSIMEFNCKCYITCICIYCFSLSCKWRYRLNARSLSPTLLVLHFLSKLSLSLIQEWLKHIYAIKINISSFFSFSFISVFTPYVLPYSTD